MDQNNAQKLIKEKAVDISPTIAMDVHNLQKYTLFHTLDIYSKNPQLKCDQQWSSIHVFPMQN